MYVDNFLAKVKHMANFCGPFLAIVALMQQTAFCIYGILLHNLDLEKKLYVLKVHPQCDVFVLFQTKIKP